MGARGPAKIQLRSRVHKCEICNKKFSSTAVLRSHQQSTHTFSPKTLTKKGNLKKKSNQKSKIVVKPVITTVPKQVAESSKRKSDVGVKTDLPKLDFGVETESNTSKNNNETEFICPLCPKVFRAYFYALKHIQKHHCVNSSGEKVSPDSPDLIKPFRKEVCRNCKKNFLSNEPHNCNFEAIKFNYVCSGCQQEFQSSRLFDMHVMGVHGTAVETMVFPTNNEFTNWKLQLEHQTKSKYTLLSKYQSKNIYRCAAPMVDNVEQVTACMCPSSLIVQEFSNSIYVKYYKSHHGHKILRYTLPERYKRCLITPMLNQSEGYMYLTDSNYDKEDLYMQFKKLMESIIVESAKLNIDNLINLVENALDMTQVLTNYNDDDDMSVSFVEKDLAITETKINKVLEGMNNPPITKRKIVNVTHVPKKILKSDDEKEVMKPKLNDEDVLKVLKELESDPEDNIDEAKPSKSMLDQKIIEKTEPAKINQSPSSFNDSYKDFVDKNFSGPAIAEPKKRVRVPTERVKTKIGQFKPVIPKPLDQNVEIKKTVMFEKRSPKRSFPLKPSKADEKTATFEKQSTKRSFPLKPSKADETTATFEKQSPKRSFPLKPIKGDEKTATFEKQSPKSFPVKPIKADEKSFKITFPIKPIKADIDYEVREQEDDCNILVLKI